MIFLQKELISVKIIAKLIYFLVLDILLVIFKSENATWDSTHPRFCFCSPCFTLIVIDNIYLTFIPPSLSSCENIDVDLWIFFFSKFYFSWRKGKIREKENLSGVKLARLHRYAASNEVMCLQENSRSVSKKIVEKRVKKREDSRNSSVYWCPPSPRQP